MNVRMFAFQNYNFHLSFLFVFLWIYLGAASASAQDNPIVTENSLPGTNTWAISNQADDVNMQIKGFASLTSVNKGDTIDFHVHVSPAQSFTIFVYRMGWYGGSGGRLMQTIGPLNGTSQPSPTLDATTGMISTSWTSSYTLQIPESWTTGMYLAKLRNANGFENYVVFTVRDDDRIADFLYQHPVTTAHAYNNFPNDGTLGKSLYNYNSYGGNVILGKPKAVKVSLDRPFPDEGAGLFFDWEVYLIWWLEQEGYDVSYATNVDLHINGSRLLDYRGFISAGHDEYWTKELYDSVEAARDAGVHLAFTGSNAAYWQSRLEDNNRTLVVYKNASADPIFATDPSLSTIKFRDLGRAEQTLIGVQYKTYVFSSSNNASYSVQNSDHWVYENSGFTDGSSVPNIVGYEVDELSPLYPGPPDNGTQVLLSDSYFVNYAGNIVYANSSIYQASSGAWVFGAGTMSWAWALTRSGYINTGIQQATSNIFDRFLEDSLPPNQAPVMSNPGDQSNTVGDAVTLQIDATDPDEDPLTFAASGLPVGLSINTDTGSINGALAADSVGSYVVDITVNDTISIVTTSFAWTVNDLPALLGDTDCSNAVDSTDALFILQYTVESRVGSGSCPLSEGINDLNISAGDVNVNGQTDVIDALMILQCQVGITNVFCPPQ